jgi:hypothetical protein
MNARRGKGLPPSEPGSFGAALANSYMWGFWLGVCNFLNAGLTADLAGGRSGYLLLALGLSSVGWAKFWALILFLVATGSTSGALREYYTFTGRTFLEDRIGFAKAGGQDIAIFAGLASTTLFVVVFARLVPANVISWIRIPLLITSSLLLGNWLTRILSRRVFSVLFGKVPRL